MSLVLSATFCGKLRLLQFFWIFFYINATESECKKLKKSREIKWQMKEE